MVFLFQWIDAIWLPVCVLFAARSHRIIAAGFVICNMIMLRLMAELMQSIGYGYGILGLLPFSVWQRGLFVYSVFSLFFVIAGRYSQKTGRSVFLASALGIFFMAAFTFAIVMVL